MWHPPHLGVLDEGAAVRERRFVLSEKVAGRTATHPDVELDHELVRGHPVAGPYGSHSTPRAWSRELGGGENSPGCRWVR